MTRRKKWPDGAEYCRLEALASAREIRTLQPRALTLITKLEQGQAGPAEFAEAKTIIAEVAFHAADIQRLLTEAKVGAD